jgi:NADH dehydrogenase
MSRSAERAEPLRTLGAEVALGDLRDPDSLRRACLGATHVITTANAFMGRGAESIAAVDERGNHQLIDAARDAGVRQFVFASARLSEPYRSIDYFAAKFRTEEYLRQSGLTYTILRPSAFMETWAQVIGEPVVRQGVARVFGSGHLPVNFVAVDDVATITVMTIDRPDARNTVLEIGGPENPTLLELVEIFERAAGRRAKRKHIPVFALRVLPLLVRPFNPVLARQMKAGYLMATIPQPFDPAPMLARYPIALTRLEDWVRARYGPRTGRA